MYAKYFKRMFDFLLSFITLLILTPLFLILTAVGAVVMKGNPFFTQLRPGKIDENTGKEKIFTILKFRTMSNGKDENGELLPDEARLNKYGRLLRSTSLDELPELWNILKGDMSIVGPRPLLLESLLYYTEEERHRHDVRPGLTGLAQVNGRNIITWKQKFDYDIEYVNSITLLGDLKIILKTVFIVLKREGINYASSAIMGEFKGTEAERADKTAESDQAP